MKTVKLDAKQVANALEDTRHSLPVEGTKAGDIAPFLEEALPKFKEMAENAKKNQGAKQQVLQKLQKLQSSLEISHATSKQCQVHLDKKKSQALKEASMKLSLQQANGGLQELNEMIDNILSLPSKPE